MMQILRNEAKGTNHHIPSSILYSTLSSEQLLLLLLLLLLLGLFSRNFMNAAPKSLSLSYNVNKLLNTWNTYSEIRETA